MVKVFFMFLMPHCMGMCAHVCACMCESVCVHVCVWLCASMYVYVCVDTRAYVCACVFMCVFVCSLSLLFQCTRLSPERLTVVFPRRSQTSPAGFSSEGRGGGPSLSP